MKNYLWYLGKSSSNNILSSGLGDWNDIGKKTLGPAQLTPVKLTATAIYFYDLSLMAKMAKITGNKEDAENYGKLAKEVKISFNKIFYNDSLHVFSTGSQTAMSMPLYLGLVDEGYRDFVIKNLTDSIKHNKNRITAGDIGFFFLIKTLENGGKSQLIYDMISQDDVPGYALQLKKGATTLSESWAANIKASNNHLMLGHAMEWFYSGLAGISQDDSSVAYKKIIISPQPVSDISWVKCSFNSPSGKITSDWEITNKTFLLIVEIPVNTIADINLPTRNSNCVFETGKKIKHCKDIKIISKPGENIKIQLGSGNYKFKVVKYINEN